MKILLLLGLGICLSIAPHSASAQFNLDGQIIQRAEFRNGFGRLIPDNETAARFIAHRARLQASYATPQFNFYMSIQDVRTWGNTPQLKPSDTFLSLHEAWVEVNFGENWKLKLGRQELNYDNFRFLGNLDWALQGRAHDFALVKYEKDNMKFHFGGAYNQDAQMLSGNLFTITNQYKTAQMVRYENRWEDLQFSLLFWNDGRQYVVRDNAGEIIEQGINYRQTLGIPTLRQQFGNTLLSGFYYHQLGKDVQGRTINAHNYNLQVTQQFDLDLEANKRVRISAGFEILSGTDTNDPSKNHSFSPLYGTNHLHNGYMDLFFVAGAHENFVGLQDYFIRTRKDFGPNFFIQLDGHAFLSHGKIWQSIDPENNIGLDSFLGTEIDLTVGYILNSAVSFQGGYSQFFYSDTFQYIQNNGKLKNNQNWAYMMLIFRPTMKNKFIGILL